MNPTIKLENIRRSPQSKTSLSPKRTIHFFEGTPKRENINKNSPLKQEIAFSPVYKRAVNQNQYLREQMYCLLVDLPAYMTTKSIGVSISRRDQLVNEAMAIMTTLLKNEQLIQRYQRVSQKLRQSMKLIHEIKSINKSIQEIYQGQNLEGIQK